MNKRIVAILAAVAGILLFSTKAVFVKLAYAHGATPVPLLALRMGFALPFYSAMIFVTRRKPSIAFSWRDFLFIFLAGFLGYYLASYFDFVGLRYVKASIERLILFTYPSLVVIISWLFFQKRASRAQLLALLISYTGIAIVFLPEINRGDSGNVLLGGAFVFLSSLSYATYIAGSGQVIPRFGAARFTSYCMTVSCILVLLHFGIQEQDWSILLHQAKPVYAYGLLMAIVSTIIPSYLISFAIKKLGSNQFAIFGSLGPISTIGLAYLFLQERLTWIQLMGGLVVIGGVLIAEKRKSRS